MNFVLIAVFFGLLMTACENDTSVTTTTLSLPTFFRMTGHAQGQDFQGRTAECSLDLIFEINETRRNPRLTEYSGVHGGEIFRLVLEEDDSGFSFFVDVYGQVEGRISSNIFELEIPVNATAEGRFWQQMSRFAGSVDEQGRGSGRWVCAPLDIDQGGYTDTLLTANGEFQIEPITANTPLYRKSPEIKMRKHRTVKLRSY